MQTPELLSALCPRGIEEIAAAAHVVQANLIELRVAWCKRTGQNAGSHDIKTPPPGPVRRMREILIDRHVIKDYSPDEITLRLRQVWGEFTALCWLFPHVDPQAPIRFDPLAADQSMRCPMHAHEKLEEVQRGLWRLRHEQRLRHDPNASHDPDFRHEHELALATPVSVFGQSVHACGDEELLCCACEYAGMLAALRWAVDSRWAWEGPGIMDVTAGSTIRE
jgi:hypothetical protein